MQGFGDSLNGGSFDLGGYTNSNVAAAKHYLALTTIFWETNFEGDGSFTFTMSATTPSATATEAGNNFVFTLAEDGKDQYAIMTITRNGIVIF
jgi:hypothetical protein